MGIWKALISIPIIWIAETVGVIEGLGIEEPISQIGYIGMLLVLFFVGLFSDE